ncbi:MAG: NUDIX domain-containing protein [Planctomycetota bacterium]
MVPRCRQRTGRATSAERGLLPRPRPWYAATIGYQDRIAACNQADLGQFVRWHPEGAPAAPGGFVRRDRLALLLAPDSPFRRVGEHVELTGASAADRTERLRRFLRPLAAAGEFSWRCEDYPLVLRHGDDEWARLDRGAVPWLGARPFGVHLCAWTRVPGAVEPAVWVAIRARDKTFGGLWDNTVAGGQPAGLSLRDNVVKECMEEASIPASLAAHAIEVATLTYVRADDSGLKPDTLFCYDLELPADFTPRPNDAEVERFVRMPRSELATAVRDREVCKPNCALVWIDFLLRHGALDAELPADERAALQRALRAPLP